MNAIADLIPNRTRDVLPDVSAEQVIAWDERRKQYVEAAPEEVMQQPRVYPFWLPDRRREKRP